MRSSKECSSQRLIHGSRMGFMIPLLSFLWALSSWSAYASSEVSGHFRGLSADAGGVTVLGARARLGWLEGSVHSYSGYSLVFSGAVRKVWLEDKFFSPSFNFSVRTGPSALGVGPGLSVLLKCLWIGPGAIALRLDNDLFYEPATRALTPQYLVGVSYVWK